MSKHTPGPWKADFDDGGGYDCMSSAYHIRKADERFGRLASLDIGDYLEKGWSEDWEVRMAQHPVAEANARLIAAAPELLEALEQTVFQLRRYTEALQYKAARPFIDMANAALKKARGE